MIYYSFIYTQHKAKSKEHLVQAQNKKEKLY